MYRFIPFPTLTAASGLLALAFSPPVQAQDFTATLSGYQEVPPVSTEASGDFWLSNSAPFDYELNYQDLEGEILFAHIHFAPPGVNGGVMVFLCNNYVLNPDPVSSPTPLPPDCTGISGEVEGTLIAADVVGPAGQGISSGEGGEALAAIRAGLAYVNVHSEDFPSGEIRGAIVMMDDDDDDDDDGDDGDDGDLEDRLSRLEKAFRRLVEAVRDHTHTYLTGRGHGHNNTEATTGPPEL